MIGEWTRQWLEAHPHPCHYTPSTTSTNSLAKNAAMTENQRLVVYLTDEQSAGRGQGSHSWINSQPGTNLLMTCSLKTQSPPQPDLCLLFGQHLKEACESVWKDLPWRLKPLNDIYLDSGKVAGILLESVSQGDRHRLLFGLGFNVLDFPQGSDFPATSLQTFLSSPLRKEDWQRFLEKLFKAILNEPLFR